MASNLQGLLEEIVKEKIPKNFNLLGKASKQTLNYDVAEVRLLFTKLYLLRIVFLNAGLVFQQNPLMNSISA